VVGACRSVVLAGTTDGNGLAICSLLAAFARLSHLGLLRAISVEDVETCHLLSALSKESGNNVRAT
jgi:hypothetical protein